MDKSGSSQAAQQRHMHQKVYSPRKNRETESTIVNQRASHHSEVHQGTQEGKWLLQGFVGMSHGLRAPPTTGNSIDIVGRRRLIRHTRCPQQPPNGPRVLLQALHGRHGRQGHKGQRVPAKVVTTKTGGVHECANSANGPSGSTHPRELRRGKHQRYQLGCGLEKIV